jgi:hypothetical protein
MVLENPQARGLTRFNGFELLAWGFNPRWAMRSSINTPAMRSSINTPAMRSSINTPAMRSSINTPA